MNPRAMTAEPRVSATRIERHHFTTARFPNSLRRAENAFAAAALLMSDCRCHSGKRFQQSAMNRPRTATTGMVHWTPPNALANGVKPTKTARMMSRACRVLRDMTTLTPHHYLNLWLIWSEPGGDPADLLPLGPHLGHVSDRAVVA